jgi:hypothetical protein
MRDEHGALRSSATLACGPALGGRGADEVPPLAVALSPSPELTESRVNAVAINVVRWGADWR